MSSHRSRKRGSRRATVLVAGLCLAGAGCARSAGTSDGGDGATTAAACSGPGGGAPARLLWPMSTSVLTTRRPALRWQRAPGATALVVELCRTRGCEQGSLIASLPSSGESVQPATELAPGVWFWRVRSAGSAACVTPTWEFTVGARSAPVATAWGSVPDVDGDGLADVLVGAPADVAGDGAVFVYHSTRAGLDPAPVALRSASHADGFGVSVASAGDVDGDGYGDVLVGANFAGGRAGRVDVFRGGPAGLVSSPALSISGPDGPGSAFGTSVAGAGDVDGDGYGDVVVGAYLTLGAAGRVHVYRGGPGGLSTTAIDIQAMSLATAQFGASVAGAGDVDGDGYSDIVVGANLHDDNRGYAAVYFGAPAGLRPTPAVLTGGGVPGPDGSRFGAWVASAGDVDGDGYADVLVSSQGDEPRVFRGVGGGVDGAGVQLAGLGVGMSSAAGDVDGDGLSDVFSGASPVRLVRGSAQRAFRAERIPASTRPGASGPVAGAGDVDGDGYADVLGTGIDGAVRLYFGAASGLRDLPTLLPEPGLRVEHFASGFVAVGDVDGDRAADYARALDDGPETLFAVVNLYSGAGTTALESPRTVSAYVRAPARYVVIAAPGDVNGDGSADLVVGTPAATAAQGSVNVIFTRAGTMQFDGVTALGPDFRRPPGFGAYVLHAGDVDHDGHADLLVASSGDTPAAERLELFRGNGQGYAQASAPVPDPSGGAIGPVALLQSSVVGDFNGDGFADLLYPVRTFPAGTLVTRLYLLAGGRAGYAASAQEVAYPFTDLERQWLFCAEAGDVDGDGIVDAAVSVIGSATREGALYVLRGARDRALSEAWALRPSATNVSIGLVHRRAGDLNGDGCSDLFAAIDSAVYVLLGSPRGPSPLPLATLPAGYASAALTALGDVDHDGFDDLVSTGALGATFYFGGRERSRPLLVQSPRASGSSPLRFGASLL